MRIAILIKTQVPYISANTSIGYVISEELQRKHDVILVGMKVSDKQNSVTDYNGIPIYFLNSSNDFSKKNLIFARFFPFFRNLFYGLKLRKLLKREKVDRVLVFTKPNDMWLFLVSSKSKIKNFWYELDPFFFDFDHLNNKMYKIMKSKIKYFDKIFTTKTLLPVYQQYFNADKNKFVGFEFPKLIKHDIANKSTAKIRLLYFGRIYKTIRSFQMLIDLRGILPCEMELNFAGGFDYDNWKDEINVDGINFIGSLDQKNLQENISKTNILINLGNKLKMQNESKIVEYISYGLPIINIYQNKDAYSLLILKRYPLALNIYYEDLQKKKKEICDFIYENRDKRISWERIEKEFYDFTPKFVSNEIVKIIS